MQPYYKEYDRVNTAQTRTTMDQTQTDFEKSRFPPQDSQLHQFQNQQHQQIVRTEKKFKITQNKINKRYEHEEKEKPIQEESGSSSENQKKSQEEKIDIVCKKGKQAQFDIQFEQVDQNYNNEDKQIYEICETPLIKGKKKGNTQLLQPVENFNPFRQCQSRTFSEFVQTFELTNPFYSKNQKSSQCVCFKKKVVPYGSSKQNLIKKGEELFTQQNQYHCDLVYSIYTKLYDTNNLTLYQSEIILKHNPTIFQLLQFSSCIDNFKDDLFLISNNNIQLMINLMMIIGSYVFDLLKQGMLDLIFKANRDDGNTLHNTLNAIQLGAYYFVLTKNCDVQNFQTYLPKQTANQYFEIWMQYKKIR